MLRSDEVLDKTQRVISQSMLATAVFGGSSGGATWERGTRGIIVRCESQLSLMTVMNCPSGHSRGDCDEKHKQEKRAVNVLDARKAMVLPDALSSS